MSTKRSITFISLGLIILTIAIPFIIHANIGYDPLASFVSALSLLTTLQYGTMLPIVNVLFVIVHFIKYKDIKFCLIGMAMSIAMGLLLNLLNLGMVYIPNTNIFIQIILFLTGFSLTALSVAMIQYGKIQKLPFEGFHLALGETFNKDINVMRVFVEISLVILSIILLLIMKFLLNFEIDFFNIINGGTIFVMLLTGPAIGFCYKKILKGE